jgi:hypothetical protein
LPVGTRWHSTILESLRRRCEIRTLQYVRTGAYM